MTETRLRGTIKTMFSERGFAFVTHSGIGQDYFFHRTELQKANIDWDQLKVGWKVEFDPVDGPRGPRALDVRVIESY